MRHEGHTALADTGQESELLREIEACEVRLRFLTVGRDRGRADEFVRELLERRDAATQRLFDLRRGPAQP
jgi:hypothetical protein